MVCLFLGSMPCLMKHTDVLSDIIILSGINELNCLSIFCLSYASFVYAKRKKIDVL
ncbi:hypothetical protein BD560DRAFT_388362 [Blakeslea trispora]|nr:hypothetical protein BD560DRAFT_388362 [Blakeslea trispora]